MAIFKCKMCGGTLEIQENQTVIECDFCGTTQTVPKLTSDRISNLYARANHYRCNNEFDRAMEIYEQILSEDNNDSEAYWSIVLCKYGIVYVEDPATHKRIPTMNRTQMVSILADPDYQNALQYADAIQRKVYEEEAKTIERIQKGILEISSREEKFDVFICYKEKDENGQRTRDSVIAQEIYYGLKEEGFKVFFARITLEDKLGTAYEPYIFSALNSSKVMIVLGTKPEYFEAVWVKNEWSRFLSQIKNGERKLLIPAYRGMDPYLLPAEFSHLQAQNMENIGFLQDLIRGVTKVVNASKPKQQEQQQVYQTVGQPTSSNPTVHNYLKRAKMFLQDGDFENALQYCEKALDLDPENSDAYLYKLLYDLKLHNEKELETYKKDLSKNINFKKAFEFGDEERRSDLEGYLNNKKIIKGKSFDIVYGCIILMNVLFLLSSLVFVSLSRNNPFDVYFTMPLQYLSILVLNIFAVVVEICSIVKLFNGSLTCKLNKLSFKIFLISFSVSTFVLVDTILAFTHCNSWVMGWLTFSFSIAVIILSFICIVYATLKNKNESWEDKRRFKLAAYLVAFIICISSIGTHIYWLNCEKVFINKLTNELTEVNCFGKNMEEFVIPEGVTSIDDYAFWNCSRLKSIEIPYSVTSIGYYAFSNCDSLTSIVIPNSVTSIGDCAFYDCDSLTSIVIPNSVTSIGYSAFAECPIEKATLPISIGTKYYFEDTLKEVIVTGDAIPDYAFQYYENLTSVTVSSSVMTIGYQAFMYCSRLKSIVISNNVTSIGGYAFEYCDSLENVYYNGTIEDWCKITFNGNHSNPMCYAEHFYLKNESNEWEELTELVIPNTITKIGEYQFCGFDNLTSIEIPNSVTSIGNYAFNFCDSLTSIVIPNSVTSIGSYVFSGCSGLTIYCESTSKPSGWNTYWNESVRPIYWAGQWEYDGNGKPIPLI